MFLGRARGCLSRVRRFWLFLAAGHLLLGFGNACAGYYELVLKIDAPVPFVGDAGFVLFYPVVFLGLAMLLSLRGRSRTRALSMLLDAFILALPIGALCWQLVAVPSLLRVSPRFRVS